MADEILTNKCIKCFIFEKPNHLHNLSVWINSIDLMTKPDVLTFFLFICIQIFHYTFHYNPYCQQVNSSYLTKHSRKKLRYLIFEIWISIPLQSYS